MSEAQSTTESDQLASATEEFIRSVIDVESNEQAEGSGEPVNDLGDAQSSQPEQEEIPNASIRLEKMRKQRDEERAQRSELERQIAEMKGKLSVLDKSGDGESQEADPTEYMDETQQYLYQQNQELKNTIGQLSEAVNSMKVKESKERLAKQETQFLDQHPELKENKDQFVDDMMGYLDGKPEIARMLSGGNLSLNEVYAMYSAGNPKSTKKAEVSNPDAVFSGSSDSVRARQTDKADIELGIKKANKVLTDPNSTNKAEATEYLLDNVVDTIYSQLNS